MAIVVNKRKRTHKQSENSTEKDEGLTIIPAKKKKSKDVKQSSKNSTCFTDSTNANINTVNGHEASDHDKENESEIKLDEDEKQKNSCIVVTETNGVEEEKQKDFNMSVTVAACNLDTNEKIKFGRDFNVLHFRAKLKGNDFIKDLNDFVCFAEKRPKVITKYIEKRGKPLELVELLERVDKTNATHVSYICEALQLVLMEILANHSEHLESAVYGCRFLLKAYAKVIDLLLNSKEFKHRKIALKLLTAIVCVDSQLGRHILATYNVLTNVNSIQKLLTHSIVEMKQEVNKIADEKILNREQKQQHQTNIETVRKCFIHFVLSYFMDGKVFLIRNILDYGPLIKSVIEGLIFDDAVTVCMVLNTLKKFVLEFAGISKTKKFHIFDFDCCKALIKLYDWCDPKVHWLKECNGNENNRKPVKSTGLLEKIIFNEIDTVSPNDSKEHEMVSKVVHEFLLVLLTSRKNGIAFDTIKYFRQKRNTLQGQVVGSIFRPWANPLKTELICKILEACPDLYRHTMRHFAGTINPVRCGQKFYVIVADFLRQIIDSCHPRHLKDAIETKFTLTDLSYWIKDICLPLESLVHITGLKLLHHRDFQVRLITNRLLLAMFQQYTNYVRLFQQQHQSKMNTNDIRKFKFDILNHLLMHFPTIESILTSLNISIEYKHNEDVDILKHMDVALDLLLLICQESRTFVNKTSVILDYFELLRPIYADENNRNIRLEMKAIKTILLLSPKVLEPSQEQFANILQSFIKAFVYGETDISREAGNLLRCIFKNTGIFESAEFEIDLWLESLHFFSDNSETIDVICQVFNEVLKVTAAAVEMPFADAETITNVKKLRQLFEYIERGVSSTGDSSSDSTELITISKLLLLIYKGVEVEEPLSSYLECVCLLMFHYYHKPAYILKLYEMQFKQFSSYMTVWIDKKSKITYKENLKMLKKFNVNIPQWLDINSYLFDNANNGNNLEKYFKNEKIPVVENEKKDEMNNEVFHPSEQLLMIYIQLVLFQVIQLKEKRQLMCWQVEKAAQFINECLKSVENQLYGNDTYQKTCLSHFVKHKEKPETEALHADSLHKLLKYIFYIRLQDLDCQKLLNETNNEIVHHESETSVAFLKFLKLLAQYCNNLNKKSVNFDVISPAYKWKLVKMITIPTSAAEEIHKYKKFSSSLKEYLEVLHAFQLNGEQCLEILNHLCDKIVYKDYFMDDNNNINGVKEYSFYYHLLVLCFEQLASIQTAIKCDHIIKKIQKLYRQFYKKFPAQEINIENLEESIYQFLKINHHYVEKITLPFFECFFVSDRKLFKSSIKLCCFVYKHSNQDNNGINDFVLNYINVENTDKKELLYPLLQIAFEKDLNNSKSSITKDNCKKLYEMFKNGFFRLIEKPQKAAQIYKESVEPAIKLIELCMPLTECKDFCIKQLKCDYVELGQIKLIQCIYRKAFNSCELNDWTKKLDIFVNFILIICNLFLVDIKTQKLSLEKCELKAFFVQEWCRELDNTNKNNVDKLEKFNFTKILQAKQWFQFCKTIIKNGMETTNDETTKACKTLGNVKGLLLKLLAYLIDYLYEDYDKKNCTDSDCEKVIYNELGPLFELIFQHSKFFDIILQQQQQQNDYYEVAQKQELLYLMYVLAKKCPDVLNQEQIPVILSAYQACLSNSDRYCLALLNLYEKYDKGLEKYKPFLWGESAISFYNLNNQIMDNDNEKVDNLDQSEITVNQIMLLIDKQLCEYTLQNFPIWRKLQTLEQMPEIEFGNPAKKALQFGNNKLEKKVEMGIDDFQKDAELRLCPKRYGIYEKCYDPAFFIPLMSMLFATENYCHPARPIQNGLLSLTFVAFSSQDKQMRVAAGCIQLRYREHFEQSHFFEKPLWIQMYNNIQAGLEQLRQNAIKFKGKNNIPRVPLISSLFIATAFNLTTDPTHLLYKQIMLHMRLKNVFDFEAIPEFNILFYSSEVEHLQYRRFIIQLICDSLKCSADLFQLLSTNTLKVLMACYGSSNTITTLDINLLILSIFSTCVKIPASLKLLIENVGIISWINSVIINIEFYQFDVIDGLITILSNLWYSLWATKAEFHNFSYLQKQLHQLIIKILPKLSARVKVANFCKLMNILNKTASIADADKNDINNNIEYEIVSREQLKHLLTCAEKHFGSILIQPLYNIFEVGGTNCPSMDDYCHQLYNDNQLDVKYILGLSSLRSYIIKWWPVNHNNNYLSIEN